MGHRLSVVSVSDYEPSEKKSWQDERALLKALSMQDIDGSFEVILVENLQLKDQPVPAELYEMVPGLQILYYDSVKSATLKDYGVSQSTGEYVAVLESDCIPGTNWLRVLMNSLQNGDYDAASGRTWYGDESSYRRVMNLLHRSWDDPGKSRETAYISNNGAIYRRAVLESYPYPDAVTPFLSAAIRNELIRTEGHRFFFERQATMKHAIGGLAFVWDYQRNKGHQCMGASPRRNPLVIPQKLGKKILENLKNVFRLGGDYLKWYDWPLLPLMMLIEIPSFVAGILDAMREVQVIPGSAYR